MTGTPKTNDDDTTMNEIIIMNTHLLEIFEMKNISEVINLLRI